MRRHKHHGFTVVELLVVIVVVALLATITTVTYRSVQADARDEARKADVMMLRAAVEDYYADNGEYPHVTGCQSPGGTNECHRNEVWQLLVNLGYLSRIPSPDLASSRYVSYNFNDGKSNYGWIRVSRTAYGIFVPMEKYTGSSHGNHCKTGKNMASSWWNSAPACDF